MNFFAVLFALLLEQARPLTPDNWVHGLLRGWVRTVRRNLDTGEVNHGWLAWGLAVGVPSVFVAAAYLALDQFSTLLSFVWLVVVLYVTLGFRQFSHHYTGIRLALERGDEAAAREGLAKWLQVNAGSLPRAELLRQVIEHAVLSAHRHVFGVLLCFVLFASMGLGPAGAVFYRVAEYVSRSWRTRLEESPSPALQTAAARGWRWVDHVPARGTALGFAVVGNFEDAVASWRTEAEQYGPAGDGVVLAATSGAISVRLRGPAGAAMTNGEEAGAEPPDRATPQLAHLASVVGLVWRSVVLWMLVLGLLTLGAWQA